MAARPARLRLVLAAAAVAAGLGACDGGLAPPEDRGPGAIRGAVRYTGRWPAADSLVDLRFVAMRFVPRDTTDFLQLDRLVFGPTKLATDVAADTFRVDSVPPGTYVYAGVAQHYSRSLFAWRPVGLVSAPFEVRSGETATVAVDVDFARLPPFPPR